MTVLVSILIVLDLLWEVPIRYCRKMRKASFNPYCAGFAVGRWANIHRVNGVDMFQSLLCWICCGKSIYKIRFVFSRKVSILIVLDLLWEARLGRRIRKNHNRFNPYCAGFAVGRQTPLPQIDSFGKVSILIVLDLLWEEMR